MFLIRYHDFFVSHAIKMVSHTIPRCIACDTVVSHALIYRRMRYNNVSHAKQSSPASISFVYACDVAYAMYRMRCTVCVHRMRCFVCDKNSVSHAIQNVSYAKQDFVAGVYQIVTGDTSHTKHNVTHALHQCIACETYRLTDAG